MNSWRIYRLPGSREVWHIDSGPCTQIFNVRSWRAADSSSKDIGGQNVPRAWIEVEGQELHIIDGVAIFEFSSVTDAIQEVLECLRKDKS